MKPVPQMIASAGCSTPSCVWMPFGVMRSIGAVTSSTLGRCSAGYQSFEIRIRLQPSE